jgi:phytoene dehydrogenase-like protein
MGETDGIVSHDAIVVGSGHNGLTAAAYLARAGLDVCVLERRDVLGGACVTEEVWPGYRVSRASYVVSMLQPKVVADLRLREHGYAAIPLDPAYATVADGGPVFFDDDPARARASIARVSRRDADAYPEFMALLARAAAFVRPLLLRAPPAIGSRRPGDLPSLVTWAARAAGLPRARLHELYRLMTMSVGDLLDEWFEHDALKGCLASTGVVGVWAGPRTPGTAYNLLHHELGSLDGAAGAWGHVRGGMGAISLALARAAEAHGATVRTGAPVASIDVAGGAVTGVTLAGGERLRAPLVVSGAHPQHDGPRARRARALPRRGRGGPAPLPHPRRLGEGQPRARRAAALRGRLGGRAGHAAPDRRRAVRVGRRPRARVAGGRPRPPGGHAVHRGRGPLGRRPDARRRRRLRRDDVQPVRAARRGRLARRQPRALAPGVPGRPRRGRASRRGLGRPRGGLAPPDLERIFGLRGGSIFHGEQDLAQLAFMRPTPELARYATPVRGLYLCGAGTHPGGGVMGASGHNAAMRVLADRRRGALRRRVLRRA